MRSQILGIKMPIADTNRNGKKRNNTLEQVLFLFFSLFIFSQCISIAVANAFLGISVFVAFLIVINNLKGFSNSKIFQNISSSRYWIILFAIFLMAMFLSALFSLEPIASCKKAFNWYFYRFSPFFIILFFFRDFKKITFFVVLALISCAIDIIAGFFLMPEGSTRLKGIFGHPMTLAGFLTVSLPIVSAYLFNWKQKSTSLIFSATFFFVYVIGLLFNGTRGAWIAVSISILVVGIWLSIKSWKKLFFLFLICIATVITFCANERFEERALSITSTTLQSNTERLLMWQSAWNMFKDNPVFGVGAGQYAKKYQNEYILPQAKERSQNHAHSNIFQMLGQSGIVGLFGFLTLFVGIFWFSLKSAIVGKSPYGIVLFAFSLSFFIHGLTEFNFGNSAVLKYYLVLLACFVVLSSRNEGLNLHLFQRKNYPEV